MDKVTAEMDITRLFHNLTWSSGILSLTVFLSSFISVYLFNRYVLSKLSIHLHSRFLISRLLYFGALWLSVLFLFHITGLHIVAVAGLIGVAGLGVGLASKDIVSNFISGIFLIGDFDIKIGDIITVDSNTGMVETIGILYTNVRIIYDGSLLKIPNNKISTSLIIDHSTYEPFQFSFTYLCKNGYDIASHLFKINEITQNLIVSNCILKPKGVLDMYEIGLITIYLKRNAIKDFMPLRSKIIRESGITYIFDFDDWEKIIIILAENFNFNMNALLESKN